MTKEPSRFTLAWPPSVNTYWRNVNGRTVLSREARAYRFNTGRACLEQGVPRLGQARVRVEILAYPPDRRRRDLDNLTKAILDALTFAEVFDDDEQVDELVVKRAEAVPPGQLVVTVAALEAEKGGAE